MTVPVYAVVCDELPDRRDACRAHLEERGVHATLWRGIHGRTWQLRTASEYDPGKHLPPGHVGLNLSVWNLWQHISLTQGGYDDEPVIVFEDDVELPEQFWGKLDELRDQLLCDFPEWDLVFLGMSELEPHVWHKVTERVGGGKSRLCRLAEPFGTHALLLRRRALSVLLEHMRRAERNLDQQLWRYVLQPGHLKWCAVLPSLVTQRTFDYEGTGKPQWGPSCVHPDDDKDTTLAPAPSPAPAAPEPSGSTTDVMVKWLDAVQTARANDTSPPAVIARTEKMVCPYPCWYRGMYLDEDGLTEQGRVVPINQCARLRVPCHSKGNVGTCHTTETGREVRSCETCELRIESSGGDRSRLPLPPGHFNCSMLMYEGRLILATRDSWGHSKVSLWALYNERSDWTRGWAVEPIGSFGSKHPEATRLEDPRLFTAPDEDGKPRLHAMLNLPQEIEVRPDGYHPKRVRVGYVRFARDLSGIDKTEVFTSPQMNLYEKNWVAWWSPVGLNLIYGGKPEHVVMGERRTWKTPNDLVWTGGVLRGGACPFPVENPRTGEPEMWHVFHGCLKRIQGSVYSVGVYAFGPEPPYTILRQTPTPILWPDLPGIGESVVKRMVLWPGGAVVHGDRLFLALGVDDTFCRIASVPLLEVSDAMSDVPETDADRGTSLLNTPVALGTRG